MACPPIPAAARVAATMDTDNKADPVLSLAALGAQQRGPEHFPLAAPSSGEGGAVGGCIDSSASDKKEGGEDEDVACF